MRTTVELRNDQRAKLLELAAHRGEKGFSLLVREAIDHYLDHVNNQEDVIAQAAAVLGSFTEDEADALRTRTRQIRDEWR